MSDKRIGPNDLVICIGGCGCWLGRIFKVQRVQFILAPSGVLCTKCQWHDSYIDIAFSDDGLWAMPASWLKRIDPPALEDTMPTREELTA